MTSDDQPCGASNARGLDVSAALARADVLGLPLNELTRAGIETNLELLALHYLAVCEGLEETGAPAS